MENVCMYLRLSREDGEDRESNSIANQRDLINTYAKNNGMIIAREFIDDGISGVTFDRPAFKQMIQAIEDKEIDTVIVKDLSRFGRDYIQAGRYLQQIFPRLNVRFISVNDNYDSDNADTNNTHFILPIKNFINDAYCRDISNKVRSSQKIKREKGQYIGSFAPFGYCKDPSDKHKLIIDNKVQAIVKEIFRLKINGYSSQAIAKIFNDTGIVTPLKHKENMDSSYKTGFATKESKWDSKMINRIIKNKVYIGYLEQGKRKKLSYKSDMTINVDKHDWVVIKNTHQPIVSETIYNLANKLLLRDTKNFDSKPAYFSGMLFCKDCKSPMTQRKYKVKNGVINTYICSNYNKGCDCTRHSVKEIDLKNAINRMIKERIEFQDAMLDEVANININAKEITLNNDSLQKEKEKYEIMQKSLYMDLEDGLIDQSDFETFRKMYIDDIYKVEQKIKKRKDTVKNIQEILDQYQLKIKTLKNKHRLDEIDRETLVFMVDRIEIGENKDVDIIFNDGEEIKFLTSLVEDSDILGGVNHG